MGGTVARLEDLSPCTLVEGVLADSPVAVVNTEWRGASSISSA